MKIALIIWLVIISSLWEAEESYRISSGISENERAKYAPESHYKVLGVEINNSTLEGIKRIVGGAKIYEGSHTAKHLCYITKEQKIKFTISSIGFGYEVSRKGHEDTSKCNYI